MTFRRVDTRVDIRAKVLVVPAQGIGSIPLPVNDVRLCNLTFVELGTRQRVRQSRLRFDLENFGGLDALDRGRVRGLFYLQPPSALCYAVRVRCCDGDSGVAGGRLFLMLDYNLFVFQLITFRSSSRRSLSAPYADPLLYPGDLWLQVGALRYELCPLTSTEKGHGRPWEKVFLSTSPSPDPRFGCSCP